MLMVIATNCCIRRRYRRTSILSSIIILERHNSVNCRAGHLFICLFVGLCLCQCLCNDFLRSVDSPAKCFVLGQFNLFWILNFVLFFCFLIMWGSCGGVGVVDVLRCDGTRTNVKTSFSVCFWYDCSLSRSKSKDERNDNQICCFFDENIIC